MNYCRICNIKLNKIFCDLGYSPLANNYVINKKHKDKFIPLKVLFCDNCKLIQLPQYISPSKIFKKYDYFSSYSKSWIDHSKNFTDFIIKFCNLGVRSKVCEIASNDGYLLQFFKKKKINVFGIEPASNVANVAKAKGVPTEKVFFGEKVSKKILRKYGYQDLVIGNNVLAHVPNIKDFCLGIRNLLSERGIATLEFPHVYNLIKKSQFDTIYHEHFSYLSIHSLDKLMKHLKMEIFNIQKLNTHGGSIRIFIKKKSNKYFKKNLSIENLLQLEKKSKIFTNQSFKNFNKKIANIKKKTLEKLFELKIQKKKVIAYGAPAKGNTFLNYCMINKNLIKFTVDKNPNKIGKFLPGSRIPIYHPKKIIKEKPDYIVILPWNLSKEIIKEIKSYYSNCKFITFIPKISIFN